MVDGHISLVSVQLADIRLDCDATRGDASEEAYLRYSVVQYFAIRDFLGVSLHRHTSSLRSKCCLPRVIRIAGKDALNLPPPYSHIPAIKYG